MKYFIGVDIGTSSAKTVLFNQNFQVEAAASQDYPMSQPQNGWAEQNPDDWAEAALSTITAVIREAGISGKEVRGIGLSGQMHSLVMLDEHNKVIRPAILWCDQRTAAECDEITRRVGEENLISLTANPALTGFTASKILWVRNHEPENYARCRHILLAKDYVRLILTGVYATDVSDASGMQLLDVPGRCWSQEILEALEINSALLPAVYESPEVTGTILPEIAEKTGLSTETAVVGGAGDNAAAAVGTGVVTQGKAFTTIGTSGVVFAHTDEVLIDPMGRVHTFCCAVPNCWHVMGVTLSAGLSLKWFRDTFCQEDMKKAREQHLNIYEEMDHDAAQIPIGADRLLYLPYLMGERSPKLDPDCRGVFFGLSAIHQKAHMIRAIMEGVAFSMKDCNDVLCEMGVHIKEMTACGGGGSSALWRQMLADLYDCPVQTPASQEGGALGAALLAATGTGFFPDVPTACQTVLKADPEKSCPPVPEHTAAYRPYYALYKKLYADLKEDFKALKKCGK